MTAERSPSRTAPGGFLTLLWRQTMHGISMMGCASYPTHWSFVYLLEGTDEAPPVGKEVASAQALRQRGQIQDSPG
ncbi:hypothetical protein Sphch_4034 [Sphingobium chlorophenolicum L-1]|uniref:Uncharacterized protein n=1 Tax=Sphingobium chlorophenolicum L-1 TaxID=690566 RepID=F6F247_SPHCR|nr:hypothetical protein [Sphingobium chlorophenolicum]AEG51613.1 hypothetical protein Sphch_4034 [Sphingobium chlorophenolicum L-1]